jgi:hypothetical protein
MAKKPQVLGPLQKEWVRCLRSKAFKQTRGCLFRLDGVAKGETIPNCCLGVACLVAEANGVTLQFVDVRSQLIVNGKGSVLPEPVVEKMRFHNHWGFLHSPIVTDDNQTCVELTEANDNGVTFKEIADFVEANPEAVFAGPA